MASLGLGSFDSVVSITAKSMHWWFGCNYFIIKLVGLIVALLDCSGLGFVHWVFRYKTNTTNTGFAVRSQLKDFLNYFVQYFLILVLFAYIPVNFVLINTAKHWPLSCDRLFLITIT